MVRGATETGSVISIDFMQRRALLISMIVAIAALSVACTSSDSDATTSSTTDAPVTTMAVSQDSQPDTDSTTTTAQPKSILTAPEYKIVDRIQGEGEGEGDTVIVLLDPATYDSLTDLDLYDLIAEIVELFPPVAVVHVVDDEPAANVVGDPDASEADREAVAMNYLARLDNGFNITYLGPFASSGTAVLGS